VKRLRRKLWIAPMMLLLCAEFGISPVPPAVFAQEANSADNQSWMGSISSGVKRGFDRIGGALNPKSPSPATREDDAVSLKSKSKPSANLYVAIARLYAEADKLGEAEQQYQLALKTKTDYLPALLGCAELRDRMGRPDDAIQYYQRAAKVYPQEPSVYNNLGLCYARQHRLDDAAAALTRAVQLDPKNLRYRNNIATVLVDQGHIQEALAHLRQGHNEAAAQYNLAYLLNKKGQTQAALQHFSLALQADPSMAAAQHWIDYLQKRTMQARLPQQPTVGRMPTTDNGIEPDSPRNPTPRFPGVARENTEQVRSLPTRPNDEAQPPPSLPEAPMPEPPRRLPPTSSREPQPQGPSLPGITYNGNESPSTPSAPLPPATNSAVRHLPRVN
jgi:tetratricopeptide (TPR) repeat protein